MTLGVCSQHDIHKYSQIFPSVNRGSGIIVKTSLGLLEITAICVTFVPQLAQVSLKVLLMIFNIDMVDCFPINVYVLVFLKKQCIEGHIL